jgi:ribosomal protein L15
VESPQASVRPQAKDTRARRHARELASLDVASRAVRCPSPGDFPSGFISRNRVEYAIINVGQLAEIEANSVVDINYLRERGMIKKGPALLKVLGDGELNTALTVYADKFSKSAAERISAAGGQAKASSEQEA